MKKNVKDVAKFVATGLACTTLVGVVSGNTNSVVESNNVAGVTCALKTCNHKAVKNIKVNEESYIAYIDKYKLGYKVNPGQEYRVTTEKSQKTAVTATVGLSAEIVSASVGVTYEEGYSKSISISGVNDSKDVKSLYQQDYYEGKKAIISYDLKNKQGNLIDSCSYKHYTNVKVQAAKFDEAQIILVK